MTGCSGEMLMSDNSIKPCAIKTVQYDTDLQCAVAHLELVALKAALGIPGVVQCLGCFETTDPDGAPILHIITE